MSGPQNLTLTAADKPGGEDVISWHVGQSNEVSKQSQSHYTEFFLLEYVDACQRLYVQDLEVEVFDCSCLNGGECLFGEAEPAIQCQCPRGYTGSMRSISTPKEGEIH